MPRKSNAWTVRTAVTLLVLSAGTFVAPAPVAVAEPAAPTWAPEFQGAINAFRRAHPQVGEAEAARRIDGLPRRVRLLQELNRHHGKQFGGAWYDGGQDMVHLQATTPATAKAFTTVASRHGVPVRTHLAKNSYAELKAEMKLLQDGRHPVLGAAARHHAGIDVKANRAVAALSPADLAKTRAGTLPLPQHIRAVARPARAPVEDVCVDRRNCGSPMRSGIILWRSFRDNPVCSLGFTASGTDGSHWAITAGHCGALNSGWGHGAQRIGPMRQRVDQGNGDVARIRVDNAYWLASSWGWMYNHGAPERPVHVDGYAPDELFMLKGEAVCLSAWHSVPGNSCGILGDVNEGGMARVDDFDACGGDSGGGWYWISSRGERWAYGIHHFSWENSDGDLCHYPGGQSWFTTIPDVHRFFDGSTGAHRIRVDVR